MPKRYFITTPIYYVNSVPHVGHALTMLVCDVTRRYRKMQGWDVWFLTGTDENAIKVMEAAASSGLPIQQFVDQISTQFRECWRSLNIEYDDFIRTTEARHVGAVQKFFSLLRENGHIYLDKYEGWYDVGAEAFVKESDLIDGKSPDGNEVRRISEENWFFRLSAFEDRLLAHIDNNPTFLLPETRKNEVVSFAKQGLRDMCITRQNPGWGIPVPGDEAKVIYVWFDALINYIAATGWPDPDHFGDLWPADVHWMAKEIFTRFHATLWPAMLMAADLPLPETIIAHGWFTFGDSKMSKSKGNVIEPRQLAGDIGSLTGCSERSAIDTVRFCLAALLPYEGDREFTTEEVLRRYNSDLANDLGNALNRTLAMAHKFVGGAIPPGEAETEVKDFIYNSVLEFEAAMELHRIDSAVEAAISVVRYLNKYIDTQAPWALAKAGDERVFTVLRSMLLALRATEGLIRPIIPWTADEIARQLGLPPLEDWKMIGTEESLPAAVTLGSPQPIFPRYDPKKQMDAATLEPIKNSEKEGEAQTLEAEPEQITIEDFMKVKLRVARILEAEPVEGSSKLVKLQIILGDERRQVLAGIRKSYEPADLVGRQVVVVANLKPATLMGLQSQGMILAADGVDGAAILLAPEEECPEGASVH